ncbi:OmpA family protein [Flavihumibacter rivuli]|uniref:OmpA family protein n=1 Tax=Flavihumibacter rivuli TaxID=2838156 RepID=UPI001BDE1814|nr:OmpA family protein [Flavihumibacter rivuli]ULQ57790.1 OmpA family protein [Flavihumibacter rivuli]
MKWFHRLLVAATLFLFPSVYSTSEAQFIKDIKRRAEEKLKRKAGDKVEEGIDKTIDGTGKKKPDGSGNNSGTASSDKTGTANKKGGAVVVEDDANANANATPTLKSYSKFDFVPGQKVVAMEDFGQDAIGDFPAKWNTNATGEIVNLDGQQGKFLMLSKEGVFMPEFITKLPDNFTLEMQVFCNPEFSFYSSGLYFMFAALKDRDKEFGNYKMYGQANREAVEVSIHPTDAGGNRGHSTFKVWVDNKETIKNEASNSKFHAKTHNQVKVSIWRQNQRLRVYLDDEKIWDIPRAFTMGKDYNSLLFMMGGTHQAIDRYVIGSIRLAIGAPDTRNKLINEGKYSTTGILFDVNKDQIRPESFGTLKDIANVLNENAAVKVKIIGHTDSDGDDAANLELSKRRAAAVKSALVNEFGIAADRLETDGKGETQPVGDNTKPEGKAQNRRVEFVKM